MRTLNIEVHDNIAIRLEEHLSGDVKLVLEHINQKSLPLEPSEKKLLALIPQHRRNLIADFLRT